jgi:hypothetical protein
MKSMTNLIVKQLPVQVLDAAAGVEAAGNRRRHVQAAGPVLAQQPRKRRQQHLTSQ